MYFSLLTLALAAMLYAVAFRWTDVTGGENGLGGITRPTLFGFNLESSTNYYWFVAAIAFLVLILLWRFHNSTVGSVLVAIRENEQRARFLGYPTNRYKLAAFVLSAGITGLAGILLLFQNRMTSADPISVAFSGELLAMVVIGGMRSFLGPGARRAVLHPVPRIPRHLHRELAVLVRPGVRRLHRVFADRPGRRRRAADRAVPQEDRRGRRDVGAPHRSCCRCRNSCGRNPMSTGRCCPPATSSRALAASRPCRASTSRLPTARLHALIGPNGAGKTTAFNLLSGMFPPDEGTVSLLGQPIAGETPEEIARAGIGRSFQITNLFPALSVGENIRLAVQARHPQRFDPITNALSIEAINAETDATIRYLGLAGIEKAEAGMLSYGGQRLLDMGVALATAPRVLLLDEPLAGLAAAERERIGAIIKRISSDLPVLLVEHDIDRVFQLADHVTVMNEGRVLLDGTVEDARTSPKVQEVYIGSGATEVAARPRETAARVSALLTATNVDTFYGKSHILNDVNFTLHENEIIALLGRNGAGKSTLLKTLIGIAPASNGSIKLGDNELIGNSSAQNARLGIGYVPQGRGLFAGMSVEQNLELGGLKRQTGNGVHWTRERIYEYFPRITRAARQPGGLSLRRRAADGGGGPRAVGRRPGVAARRTLRGPRARRGGAIVRNLRPAAQGNRHHHRRSPSRSGAGAVRYHGGAGARPGDPSGAVEGVARRSRSAPQGAVAVRKFGEAKWQTLNATSPSSAPA